MILVLTDQFDVHADKVISYIERKNVQYFRLNLDVESLKKTKVFFNGLYWYISQNAMEISTEDVECVWLRRAFVELTLEEMNDQTTDFKIWKNEWNKTLNGLYLNLKNKVWLNPIDKSYKGENKYLQAALAKEIGFQMPNTIISNNKRDLIDFAKRYNKVVFKLMAQDFYPTNNGEYRGLYVNIINCEDLEKFKDQDENPIVLQEYIDKAFEVRYTVVDSKHFACKIDSQSSKKTSVDWRRYDIPNTPHYQIEPPSFIVKKVNLLMKRIGINYGALDFIVTNNGEWFFLEINCLGQWLWIEDLTGMPISQEISEWLINHLPKKEVKSNESICK